MNKKEEINLENMITNLNQDINNKINELQRELNEEKIINDKIRKENNKLKEIISQLKQEKEKIKIIKENKINELKEKIKSLENELNIKIYELNKKYSKNTNTENSIISTKPGEKIIAVLFMTQGNFDINNYTMPCKSTDLFVKLEERLYNDYPEYKKKETYFLVNARKIKRFLTVEENKIKNNDIISLFVVDE